MALFQAENLWIQQLATGVAALVLDVSGNKANILSTKVLDEFEKALDWIEGESSLDLFILKSGKGSNFCQGLDIQELARLNNAEQAMELSSKGQRICTRLADLAVPSVAVIQGACLGAGLELALACDYRVVVDKPGTLLGFPELEWGLIPCWGGTQRLPCVVGLEHALQLILSARRLSAREALVWGLADDFIQEEMNEPPSFLAQARKRSRNSLPLETWRQWFFESNPLGRWLIFRGTEQRLHRKIPDDYPAPSEALQAVRIGVNQGFEAGLTQECQAVGRLVDGPAFHHLIHLYSRREEFRQERTRQAPEHRLRKIGVVGAGTRGAGIAYQAVFKGCQVVIRELSEDALGLAMVRLLNLFNQDIRRGVMSSADLSRNLAGIHGTTAWKGFQDLDLVIDATGEDLDKKIPLFQDLEKNTSPATILTSTSAWCMEGIRKTLENPARVAGLHFQVPVWTNPAVEIAVAVDTPDHITRALHDWVISIGKIPIKVQDRPGFLIQRIWLPCFLEAVRLLQEGIKPDQVDAAMVRFGMLFGPLEMLDQMGLDSAAALFQAMDQDFQARWQNDETFAWIQEQGWLGMKNGQGFYLYSKGRKHFHRRFWDRFRAASQDYSQLRDPMSHRDRQLAIQDRLVNLTINEARACLKEGIVDSQETLDLAMTLSGWAPHRGGPLHYASLRRIEA